MISEHQLNEIASTDTSKNEWTNKQKSNSHVKRSLTIFAGYLLLVFSSIMTRFTFLCPELPESFLDQNIPLALVSNPSEGSDIPAESRSEGEEGNWLHASLRGAPSHAPHPSLKIVATLLPLALLCSDSCPLALSFPMSFPHL